LKGYYYVPKDISCKELSSAMKFVERGTIDDNLYQKQLNEFFDGKVMAQRIKEEGRKEGREEGRKEGREEGRKEGMEEGMKEGQKKMLLTFMARSFYANDNLDESYVLEAQSEGFCFLEEEAKRAIKLVNGAAKEKEFVDALMEADLIQQSEKK